MALAVALALGGWRGLRVILVVAVPPLRLLMRDMHRMANVRCATDDLEGLGEAAENGGERQRIERSANMVVMAQVSDQVAHGAGRPDERHKADGDLCDGA